MVSFKIMFLIQKDFNTDFISCSRKKVSFLCNEFVLVSDRR